MRHVITMIGPPGSGKTTLSKLLANELGCAYISTGDFVRSLSEFNKTDQQLQIGGLSSAEELIRQWVVDEINKNKGNVVLDGFPRTVEQVNLIASMVDMVIVIDASVENCYKRMIARKRDDQDVDHKKLDKRISTFVQSFTPMLSRIDSNHIKICRVNGEREIGEVWLDVIEIFKKENIND